MSRDSSATRDAHGARAATSAARRATGAAKRATAGEDNRAAARGPDFSPLGAGSRFAGGTRPRRGLSLGIVETRLVTFDEGLTLECGAVLRPVTVAFEVYGTLNARRDNAILVCHALSGGAHAAGRHPRALKPGWWDIMIGPGKAFDTDRYCVISSNVLGSCYGTTGPGSVDPAAGLPYGSRFPAISIRDMVDLQRMLLDRLGVRSLVAAAGGSMGGMQALQWAVSYPGRVRRAIAIATTARHSAQQIALDEVARRAIVADPAWNGGDYYGSRGPVRGLAVARMLGHVTYLSDVGMAQKFGRRRCAPGVATGRGAEDARGVQAAPGVEPCGQVALSLAPLAPRFEVERYLHHQGEAFVRRFDANSLLCLTSAMDRFDLADGRPGLAHAFAGSRTRFLLMSFTSDWLYPPRQMEEVADAIRTSGGEVVYHNIASDYGHDAFLLEHARQAPLIESFLGRDVVID